MPKKDRSPSPGEATKLLNISWPPWSAYYQSARPAVSFLLAGSTPIRLVNVRENPPKPSPLLFEAHFSITDRTKNKASVMLLPTGVNNRGELKVLKMVA